MKKRTLKLLAGLAAVAVVVSGCTVCSQNRAFPKLAWYWSKDAKAERAARQAEAERHANYLRTNTPSK